MLRGFRCIILAIAGVMLIGASEPERKATGGEQSSAQARNINALSNTEVRQPAREPQDIGCDLGKEDRKSDLCAQWKAADAARKSADWASYGVIASLVGILLFMWQLDLTRKAVKDTGDATIAMREANNIAKVSAERQMRAYLGVRHFTVTGLCADETPELRFDIFNSGQTPAREVRYIARIFGFITDAHTAKIKLGKIDHPYSVGVNLPGQVGKAGGALHGTVFTGKQIELLKTEKLYLVYAGVLSYHDIFRKRHLVTFKMVMDGRSIKPDGTATLVSCRVGNNSN